MNPDLIPYAMAALLILGRIMDILSHSKDRRE